MQKYEIHLIPNYGNEQIVIDTVKQMKITTTGKTRPSGFRGCDVPVILDIVCDLNQIPELKRKLKDVRTDQVDIFDRCPHCGSGKVL